MGYSKTNERLAIELKEQINDIREVNEINWKSNDNVIDMLEEVESVGYFYDDDSWNVYANNDEYYDESPLDLYVNDDDDDDDDYDKKSYHSDSDYDDY